MRYWSQPNVSAFVFSLFAHRARYITHTVHTVSHSVMQITHHGQHMFNTLLLYYYRIINGLNICWHIRRQKLDWPLLHGTLDEKDPGAINEARLIEWVHNPRTVQSTHIRGRRNKANYMRLKTPRCHQKSRGSHSTLELSLFLVQAPTYVKHPLGR